MSTYSISNRKRLTYQNVLWISLTGAGTKQHSTRKFDESLAHVDTSVERVRPCDAGLLPAMNERRQEMELNWHRAAIPVSPTPVGETFPDLLWASLPAI